MTSDSRTRDALESVSDSLLRCELDRLNGILLDERRTLTRAEQERAVTIMAVLRRREHDASTNCS